MASLKKAYNYTTWYIWIRQGNCFFNEFMYQGIHQKPKSLIYLSIQSLYLILYRSILGRCYNFESFWISLYNLHAPGFGQFIALFLADPHKLRHTGWGVSVN